MCGVVFPRKRYIGTKKVALNHCLQTHLEGERGWGGEREGMSKKITPTGQKTHRKNKKGTFWEKMVRHFNIKGHFKKQKRYIKGALIQENVHCYLKRGIFF